MSRACLRERANPNHHRHIQQLRYLSRSASPHLGDVEVPLAVETSIQIGRSMKQLLYLLSGSAVQSRQGFLWLRQGLHHSGPTFR